MTAARYTVAVYQASADDRGFWAEVIGLPGCVAQGDTVEELTTSIRDAIGAWEETFQELDSRDRQPRPIATLTIDLEQQAASAPARSGLRDELATNAELIARTWQGYADFQAGRVSGLSD